MSAVITCLVFSLCSFLVASVLSKIFANSNQSRIEKNFISRRTSTKNPRLEKKFQLQAEITKIEKQAHDKIFKVKGRKKVLDSKAIEKIEMVLKERARQLTRLKGEKYQRCVSSGARPQNKKRKSRAPAKTTLRKVFSLKVS